MTLHEHWDRVVAIQDSSRTPKDCRKDILRALRRFPELSHQFVEKQLELDTVPLPDGAIRQAYYSGRDDLYWLSGLWQYCRISEQWRLHRGNRDIATYFDFGGSSGRVARHFASYDRSRQVYLSDLNINAVEWAAQHLPDNVTVFRGSAVPTLPFEDATIDLTTAFSVFTHIDQHELGWLAELRRASRKDGLLCITAATEECWDAWMALDARYQRMSRPGGPFHGLSQGAPMPSERVVAPRLNGTYAMVFHTKDYIRRVWGEQFDILDILPASRAVEQTLVVVRPRSV